MSDDGDEGTQHATRGGAIRARIEPEIAERIEEILRREGYSANEFSRLAGLSPGYISSFLRDAGERSISLDTLQRIADAARVSLRYLVTGDAGQDPGETVREATLSAEAPRLPGYRAGDRLFIGTGPAVSGDIVAAHAPRLGVWYFAEPVLVSAGPDMRLVHRYRSEPGVEILGPVLRVSRTVRGDPR